MRSEAGAFTMRQEAIVQRVFISGAAAAGLLALAACGQGDRDQALAPVEASSVEAASADKPSQTASTPAPGDVDALVEGTPFHATSIIPCAMAAAQPMAQCQAGVIRNADGTAVVRVTLPDGRMRNLFFDRTGAVGSDVSEADGADAQGFKAEKIEDLYKIALGRKERYEVPEALIIGG